MNNIPKHWQVKKLGEVCDKISLNKIKIKQKDYLSEGKFPVIDQGQDLIGGYYNDERLLVPAEPPYIIFGDHTKVKKFVNFRFIPGADGVKVLKPHTIFDPKFFFYLIHTVKIPDKGYARHYQFLEKENISIPPIPEQLAIVSKIEELLSDLESGKQQLLTAQQQLKVYRQSLLKSAFEGRLTNKDVIDGELPKGWKWVMLGELMESVKNGYGKKPEDTGKYKILRISSVRANSIGLTDIRYLTRELGVEYEVIENDLLFTRYNGSKEYVGVCARVPCIKEKLYYPDKLIRCRLRINEEYHSKYMQFTSNCGESRKYIQGKLKTTAGQTGISGSDLKQVPILFAPLIEQQQIVDFLESKLTICDKIEETISQSLQQAETLKQSILKKAFEGKLV